MRFVLDFNDLLPHMIKFQEAWEEKPGQGWRWDGNGRGCWLQTLTSKAPDAVLGRGWGGQSHQPSTTDFPKGPPSAGIAWVLPE